MRPGVSPLKPCTLSVKSIVFTYCCMEAEGMGVVRVALCIVGWERYNFQYSTPGEVGLCVFPTVEVPSCRKLSLPL